MLQQSKIISHLACGYVLAIGALSVMPSLFAAEITETKSGGAVAIIDTHAHISRGYRRGSAMPGAARLIARKNAKQIYRLGAQAR